MSDKIKKNYVHSHMVIKVRDFISCLAHYIDILKYLSQIILRNKNKNEIIEVNYLKIHMENFQLC